MPTRKPLDDLMNKAKEYAEFTMRNGGCVPPTMLALTPEGPVLYTPAGLGDASAKDSFANTARLICAGYGAIAVVMVLESWAVFAKDGKLPDDTPPSESVDRREFVVLMGEARGNASHSFLPILRTDAGGFFGFGEPEVIGYDTLRGRFAEILPPKMPDKQAREMAQTLLEVMGVTKASLRPTPGRN